jgi:hypothetical protein
MLNNRELPVSKDRRISWAPKHRASRLRTRAARSTFKFESTITVVDCRYECATKLVAVDNLVSWSSLEGYELLELRPNRVLVGNDDDLFSPFSFKKKDVIL